MSALPDSSQTVVTYLGYLFESGTISGKSLQPYLNDINTVHNDFEYSPSACGNLVKLVRKDFAELQGSSMIQPQQVSAFPGENMLTIVMYGLRPTASNHNIRVCACLVTKRGRGRCLCRKHVSVMWEKGRMDAGWVDGGFSFFSRADAGVLLTVINAQVSNTTLSINQAAKNVARNQAAPSSRVSSTQDDPDN
jgi:hypothetical protein